jgi:hypothetical protein
MKMIKIILPYIRYGTVFDGNPFYEWGILAKVPIPLPI